MKTNELSSSNRAMTAAFRAFVPPPGHARYEGLERDVYAHSDDAIKLPELVEIFAAWSANAEQPFRGISSDGEITPGLFTVANESAPAEAMTTAALAMLAAAAPSQRAAVALPLHSAAWRKWSNPEIYLFRHGLRLDEIAVPLRDAVLEIVRASLSAYGYRKARDCMAVNGFLGEVMGAPKILNEYSYNFSLFGEPSTTEPWGWQLHGHHLAMNCLILGAQMVVTPCFWGAEPNEIDEGPRKGLRLFQDEEARGLALMRGLPAGLRRQALIYPHALHESLPANRRNFADHLHLAGAGQDNRVIPYEGALGRDFDGAAQRELLDLIETYHRHLPDGPRCARMNEMERHLPDTRFCWIGGTEVDDPFYYRIQSPVTVIEFDHHAGIFLSNEEAQKFHIHTVMRTPNGNDYGMALVRRHCEVQQHADAHQAQR